jgi:hypothetical protein
MTDRGDHEREIAVQQRALAARQRNLAARDADEHGRALHLRAAALHDEAALVHDHIADVFDAHENPDLTESERVAIVGEAVRVLDRVTARRPRLR